MLTIGIESRDLAGSAGNFLKFMWLVDCNVGCTLHRAQQPTSLCCSALQAIPVAGMLPLQEPELVGMRPVLAQANFLCVLLAVSILFPSLPSCSVSLPNRFKLVWGRTINPLEYSPGSLARDSICQSTQLPKDTSASRIVSVETS